MAAADDHERLIKVIKRSKETTSTYALYVWNTIKQPGKPTTEEWSAEFHSGFLHRVETPRDRVIANCLAMTGTWMSVTTGEKFSGASVAQSACGIDSNNQIVDAAYLGRFAGDYSMVDRIRLVDQSNIRTYDVSDEGIIMRTSYSAKGGETDRGLSSFARQVDHSLPSEDIFSEASLTASAVPDAYQKAPVRR